MSYDYGDYLSKPKIGIQWKNTDVCFDFECLCGEWSHFDGYSTYAIECVHCGGKYDVPYTLMLNQYSGDFEAIVTSR